MNLQTSRRLVGSSSEQLGGADSRECVENVPSLECKPRYSANLHHIIKLLVTPSLQQIQILDAGITGWTQRVGLVNILLTKGRVVKTLLDAQ